MTQRVTYRRNTPYNTRSNRVKIVRTPGNKNNSLRFQHVKKNVSRPSCGTCSQKLQGIPTVRPRELATMSRPQKTVQRAYGGVVCGNCVRSRVIRAFLIEEQKIVKRVLKDNAEKEKSSAKKSKK